MPTRVAEISASVERSDVARLDEAAFADFYRRTVRGLWSYVYRVTGHAADADDIVQEAFCRLLRAGPVEADEEHSRRFLYRVASNLVVDRWRRTVRERLESEHAPATAAAPATAGASNEDVARTFAELTPRERALLWLAYVEEESHEEIATSLGLGRHSIKVLLFRARRHLRDLLVSRGWLVRT
jgi:RNA polymerase sigma-70 factor (ECF subfamily)